MEHAQKCDTCSFCFRGGGYSDGNEWGHAPEIYAPPAVNVEMLLNESVRRFPSQNVLLKASVELSMWVCAWKDSVWGDVCDSW